MKKKIISLVLCLTFLVTLLPKQKASADMGLGAIANFAFAYANSVGFNITMAGATSDYASNWMEGRVNDYVEQSGKTVAQLFGEDQLRIVAGKLAAGQQIVNGVIGFLDWMQTAYDLSDVSTQLAADNVTRPINVEGKTAYEWAYGASAYVTSELSTVGTDGTKWYNIYLNGVGYNGQTAKVLCGNQKNYSVTSSYSKIPVNNPGAIQFIYYFNFKNDPSGVTLNRLVPQSTVNAVLSPGYVAPEPLPQNKEWEGDFSGTPGFADPPTDLPDFLSRIPVGIAENNLAVTGEIVEAETGGDLPTPSPSPSPSPNPTPDYNKGSIALIIAEILSLINSLSGDTAVDPETIEQVAQEVAEQAQTVPDTITQTATQTQEAIQDATQTITDSQTEIKDAIQDQTQEITDIKDAIQDATDVPTRDKWEQVKKDLHGVFPFCIPWDIYGMLTAFSAEPRAPHFEYPFKIPSIGLDYTLELDFADFDPVAQTLRTVEIIAFSIGLAILTSKVIRW